MTFNKLIKEISPYVVEGDAEDVIDALLKLSLTSLQMLIVKDIDIDVIVYANESAAKSIGVSVEDLIGSKSSRFYREYELFHSDDLEIHESGVAKINYPEQYVDADGTAHQLISSKAPFTGKTGVKYVAIAAQDVTMTLDAVSSGDSPGRSFDPKTIREEQIRHRRLQREMYE